MEAQLSWEAMEWPSWVPASIRESIAKHHETPADWRSAAARYRTCPDIGEVITLPSIATHEPVTGRWINMWGNIGRLVMPDGQSEPVGMPFRQGPRQPDELELNDRAKQLVEGAIAPRSATVYSFRGSGQWRDWFIATIDDDAAVLSITSDYGEWSHRWPSERETLTHSLAWSFDRHYVSGKLTTREQRQVYDPAATEKRIREHILEWRRQGDLTKEDARTAWDGLDDLDTWENEQCLVGELHDLDATLKSPGALFGWEAYECLQHKPRASYVHLRDTYLPALAQRLRTLPREVEPTPLPGTATDDREWAWENDAVGARNGPFLTREDAISDAEDYFWGDACPCHVDVGRVDPPTIAHHIGADMEIVQAQVEMGLAGDYCLDAPAEVVILPGAEDAMHEWIETYVSVRNPAWVMGDKTETVVLDGPDE